MAHILRIFVDNCWLISGCWLIGISQFFCKLRTAQSHRALRSLFKSQIVDAAIPDELPVDYDISLIDFRRANHLNMMALEQFNCGVYLLPSFSLETALVTSDDGDIDIFGDQSEEPFDLCGMQVGYDNLKLFTVSENKAEFLEQDRLRESAQRKSDQRHMDFVGNEIYTLPGLFTDESTDPTFEQAFLLLRKHKLRKIFPTLPDDDRKLLRLYYFRFYTMEEIGQEFGISKMAVSKQLRKILDHLRGLMEDETP